jgi:hypothetical protein
MMVMRRLSRGMHMVVMMVMMMVMVMHRHRRGLSRVFGKGGRRSERDRQRSGEYKLLHRVEFPLFIPRSEDRGGKLQD